MQAISLYRELDSISPTNSAVQLSELSMVLNNLGSLNTVEGRFPEARQAYEQGLQIHRYLALKDPDSYLPDMGRSLLNLGHFFRVTGQTNEAIAVSRELSDVLRRMKVFTPAGPMSDSFCSYPNTTSSAARILR